MKKFIVVGFMGLVMYACNSSNTDKNGSGSETTNDEEVGTEKISTPGGDPPAYDPNRGSGKFTHVDLGKGLDITMADAGGKIYGVKCTGCHKLTGEKLVGPGWLGVTQRHKPEWIMNFITNTDEMLEKDPKAKDQLEICLVRMPNQSLPDDDARRLLEFMRKNDGAK